MKLIENKTFDEERALYGSDGVCVKNCTFAGPADGESAFKESRNIEISDCRFDLRYPFWHCKNVSAERLELSELCRAAIWYTDGMRIKDSKLHGIKAARECKNIVLDGCDIISPEFCWRTKGVSINNSSLSSEYAFFGCSDMEISGLQMSGKYSFQYTENVVVRDSVLDTKDAFWHSKNVTVYDSVIKGEYLAWYAENLRLVRCKIIGTQPLCYVQGLIMEDCETEGCDLAFEYSTVNATLKDIISVYNVHKGKIVAQSIGEVIRDRYALPDSDAEIIISKSDEA